MKQIHPFDLRCVFRFAASLCLLMGLSGCGNTHYYWQSVSGHWQLLQATKPVEQWLDDPKTPQALKDRLLLAQRIRQFAVTELALPDNASYRRYADLHRRAVVWNVVAAPELSLTLKTWCFPVAGCVGYRGYFSEAEAKAQAERLKAEGLEVGVYGVPAYSTLGWMNWAGGDPLLNTFINYPEGELARMIFHELAHQVLYVKDDTRFNESFATTVEKLGGARWLETQGSVQARKEYAAYDARRLQFRALTLKTRNRLKQIYEENWPETVYSKQKLAMKIIAINEFRENYAQLKSSWAGYSGYDNWVANANNASFGAQAAYDDWVPNFEALFERQTADQPAQKWQRFYDAVKQLAELAPEQRSAAMQVLNP